MLDFNLPPPRSRLLPGFDVSKRGSGEGIFRLREVLGWGLHFAEPSFHAAQFGEQFAIEEKLLQGLV